MQASVNVVVCRPLCACLSHHSLALSLPLTLSSLFIRINMWNSEECACACNLLHLSKEEKKRTIGFDTNSWHKKQKILFFVSNIFSSQFKCLSRKKIGITAPHYMKKSLTQSPLFLGTKKVCVKKINLRRFLDFSTHKKFNLHLRVKNRYEKLRYETKSFDTSAY